jgi:hypothetical protein
MQDDVRRDDPELGEIGEEENVLNPSKLGRGLKHSKHHLQTNFGQLLHDVLLALQVSELLV